MSNDRRRVYSYPWAQADEKAVYVDHRPRLGDLSQHEGAQATGVGLIGRGRVSGINSHEIPTFLNPEKVPQVLMIVIFEFCMAIPAIKAVERLGL